MQTPTAFAGMLLLLAATASLRAAAPARLEWAGWDSAGRGRLTQLAPTQHVAHLEVSTNLTVWRELARLHVPFREFPDLTSTGAPARFYRTRLSPRTAADDGKHHAVYPRDEFLSPEPAWDRFEPRWIKFALVLAEPDRVYFQDSTRYPFHYEFAVTRLPPFQGLSRAAFDQVSLRRAGQQVVLGAVLFAPGELRELGIQFVGLDPYPPEQVAGWFDQVNAVIEAPPEVTRFYFPTYEQQAVAEAHREFFARRGIAVGSPARWVATDECYAPGWALGRLVHLAPGELDAAVGDGRLRPEDVLVLEAVPAEIPPVAGVIALTPATPNSHVAILARTQGIPFAYFAQEDVRATLRQWNGQEVVLRVTADLWGCGVRAVNVQDQLTAEQRAVLQALKAPPALKLTAKQPRGVWSLPADTLVPADLRFVGGKAAHFGLLRRALPDHSPQPALAFTFDLWDAYLDQVLPGGQTLRDQVAARLAGFTWPPELPRLRATLAELRNLFRNGTDFSPALRQTILEALAQAGFAPDRNLRFRSSTNVEDSESFSGAGLYDSYSGCLADELDGDSRGPSLCDPTETGERGVFRALRRVFASFYNENAFLERLRHGVDESTVGMAVLVHPSTPDPIELANGVATVEVDKRFAGQRWLTLRLVTQAGAVSVANADPTARPEVVRATLWGAGLLDLNRESGSSLVPLGASVLEWNREYQELVRLLDQATRAYEEVFPDRKEFTLDFEYKKVAPEGRLQVKQLRPVPRPTPRPSPPWLLNETNRWGVFQGEHGGLFGNHRLKSFWQIQTANLPLAHPLPETSPLRAIEVTWLEGLSPMTRRGALATFPEHASRREDSVWLDRWSWGEGAGRRTLELRTSLPTELLPGRPPLVFLSDGSLEFTVTHSQPQPELDWDGPTQTRTDRVGLAPLEPVGPRSLPQVRLFTHRGLTVETRFYWPPHPTGPVAGYTAPVQAWVETRLTGLTSRPVVLRSEFAQTYRPGHHNFTEDFLFDPHLEPDLDPDLRAELLARNLRGVVIRGSANDVLDVWLWGLDDRLTRP